LQEVLIVSNDRAEISRLGAWVAQLGRTWRWSEANQFRIDQALAEAVTNVIEYAFDNTEPREIAISVERKDGATLFLIADEGVAFDPLHASAKPLDISLEVADPGGWGLHLIRNCCDRCSYERVRNTNRLTLAFDDAPGGPEALGTSKPGNSQSQTGADSFRTHPILREIPSPAFEAMVGLCKEVSLAAGAVVLAEGEANHTLYFLLSGRLRVHIGSRDSLISFAVLPGEIVGEMSVIESKPVSAWVVTEESSTLLAMPEDVFWDKFMRVSQASRSLLQFLISRVRKTDAVLQQDVERRVRYENLQRELASAAKIQANILPALRPLLPDPRVDTHATMRPAREVSGDFYDALVLNDHTVAVAVGDVSGKGMPAAMFMVRAITLLRMYLLRDKDHSQILPTINRILCEGNDEFMFVTLAVVILDTGTGRLTYLNGGHNPPFLARKGELFQPMNVPKGTLLGVEPRSAFEVQEGNLSPGDTLVLYTDGVTEAENSLKEQFTDARAARALDEAHRAMGAAVVAESLEKAVLGFAGDAPQSDDITILVLRIPERS
jgi:sigma-B regulation protein RsbU (phosphoserine phosphatase)